MYQNPKSVGLEWDSVTGRLVKDVLPMSPVNAPVPTQYLHTEVDPPLNHSTDISKDKMDERIRRKYITCDPSLYVTPSKTRRDVIIIGGGHNGLVSAAYLAKAGLDTLVLERRHCVGGAAVTEEIVPGFKFSRASYLAGLLRPQIITDLELDKYGFKYLPRNPSSFTPTKLDSINGGKYLLLGESDAENCRSIAQFSQKDAKAYLKYEAFLGQIRDIMQPLLDNAPPDLTEGGLREKMRTVKALSELASVGYRNRDVLVPFYELFTGPAAHILDRWFESEILKTTLATDAVVGALVSPSQNGSAYVLLHHVMGEAAGRKGVWAYVQGGMGSVSEAIASSARSKGAEIVTNATVRRILTEGDRAVGVRMDDGSELFADTILSGTTPYHTFMELLPGLARGGVEEVNPVPPDFTHHIRHADYSCGAFKINCAVDRLPNFSCYPSPADGSPGPMHKGTVHFESTMEEIDHAYREASVGMPATRPVIEMTIPSSLDETISPPGQHVVQLFVQFAPYQLDSKVGHWADPAFKNAFADRCFRIVEEFCPGFMASVLGRDVLSPLDLEQIFGLHRGSISHGSLGLHQLGFARPVSGFSSYRSPVKGLYMCGAGTHPGGGVMGAAGRNCSNVVLSDLKRG
eukprot:gene21985-28072_t